MKEPLSVQIETIEVVVLERSKDVWGLYDIATDSRRSRGRGVRTAAVKALERIGGPEVLEPLVRLSAQAYYRVPIGNPARAAREAAIRPVEDLVAEEAARADSSEAKSTLLRLLKSGDVRTRCRAAVLLGSLRNTTAVEELREAQIDPEQIVREAAARSVYRLLKGTGPSQDQSVK